MENNHHALLYRASSVCSHVLPQTDESVEIDNLYLEKFGVDDARELVRKANNKPSEAVIQLLIVRANFITLEAQNALLKVLEEPPVTTRFAFVVPHDFVVIPTLISRFSEQSSEVGDVQMDESEIFKTFLKQEYKDRLVSIEQSAKKQDLNWQRSMKQGLIIYLKEKPADYSKSLKELEFVARLLLTRGASNKMLLEHAALILPLR